MHKIVLKKRGVSPVAAGHPWVFADSIDEFPPHAKVGDEVKLVAPDGNFLAWGLYSPHSMIRARLYSFDRDAPFSRELLSARIASAIALRERVVRHDTDSCRLVFGEGDSLPGLLVDRYGDSIAVTFTTAPMAMRAEMVLEILEELLAPACVIALPDPSAEKKEKFRHPTGVLAGELPERLIATENGIRYVVDVESAQRKMLYFDQRENRAAVADNARGRMLDLYCYSGGFSLNCALSESTQEALAVDSSEGALKMLEANIAENEIEKGIFMLREDVSKACRQLEAKGEVFDTVVLDPPRLVSERRELQSGLKKYARINEMALNVVAPGGLFVSCSCSGLVKPNDLLRSIAIAASRAKRDVSLIEMRGQAPCHPVSPFCPETSYLKCALLLVR